MGLMQRLKDDFRSGIATLRLGTAHAVLREVARRLAHELKNPLTAIRGYVLTGDPTSLQPLQSLTAPAAQQRSRQLNALVRQDEDLRMPLEAAGASARTWFNQFAQPLMRQLGWPTLFCHDLATDAAGRIVGYRLRQPNPKRQAVLALQTLYYRTIAAGDSYNDTTMLAQADAGILFSAPANVVAEFPQFPAVETYDELKSAFIAASERELKL